MVNQITSEEKRRREVCSSGQGRTEWEAGADWQKLQASCATFPRLYLRRAEMPHVRPTLPFSLRIVALSSLSDNKTHTAAPIPVSKPPPPTPPQTTIAPSSDPLRFRIAPTSSFCSHHSSLLCLRFSITYRPPLPLSAFIQKPLPLRFFVAIVNSSFATAQLASRSSAAPSFHSFPNAPLPRRHLLAVSDLAHSPSVAEHVKRNADPRTSLTPLSDHRLAAAQAPRRHGREVRLTLLLHLRVSSLRDQQIWRRGHRQKDLSCRVPGRDRRQTGEVEHQNRRRDRSRWVSTGDHTRCRTES